MRHKIVIQRDRPFRNLGMTRLVRRVVRTVLEAERVDVPCQVEIRITDDEGIRELNREYRNVDRPTDVLSFPLQELIPGDFSADPLELDPETGRLWLGDVVISAVRVRAQAAEFGHSTAREAAYLTVHSILHLLGYDHMDEGEMKKAMRAREDAVLNSMGLTR